MPYYAYHCPMHGDFDQQGGYDDAFVPCSCGKNSKRQEVYVDQGVIFKGGGFTKSVVPPPGPDADAVKGKALKAHGWDTDRAINKLRSGITTDERGERHVDLRKLSKI